MTGRLLTLPSLVFLLASGALLAVGCSAEQPGQADVDVAGTWLGALEEPVRSLRAVVTFEREENGYGGTLDSPDEGVLGLPLARVKVAGASVAFDIPAIEVSFSGELSGDGQTLSGTAFQAGEAAEIAFARQPGPIDYRRPQDPLPPFPYRVEDVTFDNPGASVTLAGTLTWPEGDGPFDVVVMIGGSGPQDRNEELLNHRPFLVLADALARANVASLRYDDRGVAASTGNFAAATTEDFASDARAAVEFCRSQDRFAGRRLGLLGHSEGGIIGPLAADENALVDYLVLLAGTGVPGGEIITSQSAAIAAAQGMEGAALDQSQALLGGLVDCLRSSADEVAVEACMRGVLDAGGVSGQAQAATIAGMNTAWMRYFVNYDPAPALRRTRVPVLALNGSLDLQVLADLNLPAIESALAAAGNTRASVQLLPGLNHLFQHAETGLPSEYGMIAETIAPEVLALVTEWIDAL